MTGDITIVDLALFVGVLILMGIAVMFMGGGSQHRMKQRAGKLSNRTGKVVRGPDIATSLRRKTDDESLPLFTKILKKLPNMTVMRDRLERSGTPLSAEKYLMISVVVFIVITMLITAMGKPVFLAVPLGIVVALGLPHFFINFRIRKLQKDFLQLFPDAIDLIVRGLRSGLPVAESIQLCSKEVADPVGKVFGSIADQLKVGITLERALQDNARKLGLTEFNFFVTSIILQRETGGNLGEILDNLSNVLRSRFMMRMKIKAMSSEAKASAIIIGALPFVVILAVQFTTPSYLRPLIDDWRGNLCALGGLTSLTMGITIMIRMTKFEI